MYICLCKAVTQKQIEHSVSQGANYAQLREELGVGTDCGSCGQCAKQLVNEYSSKQSLLFREAS